MWPAWLRSVVPTVWPVGLFENYCKPLRGGMCHVPPIDSWQAPLSFRRFGASNGATPGPIGPAVRALFPKMIGHTHWLTGWLTDWQTRPGQLFFTYPPEEIFVHRTFNAKAFERSFTTILDERNLNQLCNFTSLHFPHITLARTGCRLFFRGFSQIAKNGGT